MQVGCGLIGGALPRESFGEAPGCDPQVFDERSLAAEASHACCHRSDVAVGHEETCFAVSH
jgi:hypothetical protein